MARMKEITVSKGTTLNTGNYTSVRIDVEMVVSLDEGDDWDVEYEKLSTKVQKKLDEEAREILKAIL